MSWRASGIACAAHARSHNLVHRAAVKDSRQAVRITPRVGLHPTTEPPVSQDGQDHRVRQPEGRRRQDDDDAEPRRRVRGGGPPRAVRRHGPAGQPDDVAGHRPRLARAVDVRRARAQDLDPRGDPQARDRRRLRVDRPRRRRDRDGADDRPRARAAARLRADPRGLRLHLHRHAAEPRPADDQRADGRGQGDRPRAVRVSVDARPDPAAEHASA